jgi:hypothetical protein
LSIDRASGYDVANDFVHETIIKMREETYKASRPLTGLLANIVGELVRKRQRQPLGSDGVADLLRLLAGPHRAERRGPVRHHVRHTPHAGYRPP